MNLRFQNAKLCVSLLKVEFGFPEILSLHFDFQFSKIPLPL